MGAEFAGSYIGAGTYYKLISIEKPRTAENDLYNSADEFFAKLMSAADRLLATQDTKDLEKQLKAAVNTAEMKKILGI